MDFVKIDSTSRDKDPQKLQKILELSQKQLKKETKLVSLKLNEQTRILVRPEHCNAEYAAKARKKLGL